MTDMIYDFTKFDEHHFLETMMKRLHAPLGLGYKQLTIEQKREKLKPYMQQFSQETWYQDHVVPYNNEFLLADEA